MSPIRSHPPVGSERRFQHLRWQSSDASRPSSRPASSTRCHTRQRSGTAAPAIRRASSGRCTAAAAVAGVGGDRSGLVRVCCLLRRRAGPRRCTAGSQPPVPPDPRSPEVIDTGEDAAMSDYLEFVPVEGRVLVLAAFCGAVPWSTGRPLAPGRRAITELRQRWIQAPSQADLTPGKR